MYMTITFATNDIRPAIERSLSIIGKRSTDDNGNLMFRDITIGSKEQDIITDYIQEAIIDLSDILSAHITASTDTTITITLPSTHNTDLQPFIQKACKAYCVSYSLASWFNVTAPRLTAKYEANCQKQSAAVIRLIHEKQAPQGDTDVLGTSTSIT